VLVLGDSFSNIYSLASMGWGDSAGFAEQLSYTLGRPVDRIVQNSDGAYATRLALRRMLATGEDRLAGTRVVIWQFAARELAMGDWRVIELPETALR
jgi:alginate O-acetyltransferase complex protein AlgJ